MPIILAALVGYALGQYITQEEWKKSGGYPGDKKYFFFGERGVTDGSV